MYQLLIKFLLILVLLCCSVSIGILISNHFRKRKQFFNELLSFLGFSNDYIKHSNEKILSIIDKYKTTNIAFKNLLCEYKNFILNKKEKEEFLFNIREILYFLNEEEFSIINEIFLSFGEFDEVGEINKLETSKKRIETILKKVVSENNKFSPFFIKMSILVGLFLFILFV